MNKNKMDTAKVYLGTLIALLIVIFMLSSIRQTETITQKLQDGLIQLQGNSGNMLEVATMTLSEDFQEKDELAIKIWGIPINLGTTEAFLHIPVTYRFHILLTDKWQIQETDAAVIVTAPIIRPSLPPAPDMSAGTWRSARGWLRFNELDTIARVKQSITPNLTVRARQYSQTDLVKNAARPSVAKFLTDAFSFLSEPAKRKLLIIKFADEAAQRQG